MEEVSIFDIILDEENFDNIVLYDEKNKPEEFEQVAYIPLEDKDYAILKPVKPFEGMQDDEAIVFEMAEDEDGEQLIAVSDEKVIDAVFAEYNKLFDEKESKK